MAGYGENSTVSDIFSQSEPETFHLSKLRIQNFKRFNDLDNNTERHFSLTINKKNYLYHMKFYSIIPDNFFSPWER